MARSYPLASIDIHPRLQIRGGTDYATVKRYKKAMMSGDQFPALQLARIGTKLYVIDGHHRLEAAEQIGVSAILGTERRMSLDAAHRASLLSNQDHGRRVTNKEKRAAFDGFIEAGLHLNALGSPKSLNAILREFPLYSRGHLGKLLQSRNIDAPRDDVAPYRYGEDEPSEEDWALEDEMLGKAFQQGLEALQETYGLLSDDGRQVALSALRQLVSDLHPSASNPLEI